MPVTHHPCPCATQTGHMADLGVWVSAADVRVLATDAWKSANGSPPLLLLPPAAARSALAVDSVAESSSSSSSGSGLQLPSTPHTSTSSSTSTSQTSPSSTSASVSVSVLAMLEEAVCAHATAFVGTKVRMGGRDDGAYPGRYSTGSAGTA